MIALFFGIAVMISLVRLLWPPVNQSRPVVRYTEEQCRELERLWNLLNEDQKREVMEKVGG